MIDITMINKYHITFNSMTDENDLILYIFNIYIYNIEKENTIYCLAIGYYLPITL